MSARILVVDDEPANRFLLESILVPEGYETVPAENGRLALGILAGGGVDLVLLDVMMPELDGIAACRAIRDDPRHAALPVILVTALHDQVSRARGKAVGADDFITKPVYDEELLARVRVLVRSRAQQAALEAAREASRIARERLANLVVHDLKSPLSVIVANLEFVHDTLRKGGRDKELVASLEDASMGAQQLQSMLLDLLDIGLAEDGRLPFTPAPGDVGAVVSESAASFKAVVRGRGCSLRIHAEAAPLVFDDGLIARVAQNLLVNAARYARTVVEVSVRCSAHEVVVAVENDGPPISPEMRIAIFEKFGAVSEGQTAANRGLGLYLCRLVAARHGGTIAARDRVGGGACFELTLPR